MQAGHTHIRQFRGMIFETCVHETERPTKREGGTEEKRK